MYVGGGLVCEWSLAPTWAMINGPGGVSRERGLFLMLRPLT